MRSKPMEVLRFLVRSSRRVAVSIVGGLLVAGGIAMFVTPGPGILVIAIGFAVLGTEYVWAAAALERTKRSASQAGNVARGGLRSVGRRMRRQQP